MPDSRRLTAAETVERYAGNSIRIGREYGGPIDREIYFARDGALHVVDLDRELILDGTWKLAGDSQINLFFRVGMIADGKAYQEAPDRMTMYIFVLPDGTASVFSRSSEGAVTSTQPKPTPGFKARARFDAIKRKIEKALAS